MNKLIKIAVWALVISILASSVGLIARAFGDDYKTLSHQFNVVYADLLSKKIKAFPKNAPVILFLKNGSEVVGIFKGYSEYDEGIWIKERGHWLQSVYGINELFDVSINVKEPV